jgi:hypothetical protein
MSIATAMMHRLDDDGEYDDLGSARPLRRRHHAPKTSTTFDGGKMANWERGRHCYGYHVIAYVKRTIRP